MKFWYVQTKTLPSQLQAEEAPWRKCDVLNRRMTINYHLILKKIPKVDRLTSDSASQHYAHDHND